MYPQILHKTYQEIAAVTSGYNVKPNTIVNTYYIPAYKPLRCITCIYDSRLFFPFLDLFAVQYRAVIYKE